MTKVLDHGSVELIDHMANDLKVTGAARVSTGKEAWRSAAEVDVEKDKKLIGYLMKNGHGTPFEHAVFQFFVKAPIFVVREWQRHRIASYNEFSLRYAELATEGDEEFYIPDRIRVPDPDNKQSSVLIDDRNVDELTPLGQAEDSLREAIWHQSRYSLSTYRMLLKTGVAREMARMVLPVNIYTRFWFTINARSLMNFLMLRNAPGAQWEIQQYAKALEEDFLNQMPWTYQAFVNNERKAP